MKIAFFEVDKKEQAFFEQACSEHELFFSKETINIAKASKQHDADALCVFIKSTITSDILENYPSCKLIVTRSTGFDHIDLTACKNIVVCNVPAYGEHTVAEHTFALLLAMSRKLQEKPNTREDLCGFDLHEKTIGIIGAGKIGVCVAKIAKGFDMHVLAYDVYQQPQLAQQIGFSYTTLAELYKESDIITLHTPLLPTTKHMINDKAFAQMKNGVVLINTARGELVDNTALYDALESEKVQAAGLDVIDGEAAQHHDALMQKIIKHPKVIFTPHNAYNSREAVQRILATSAENLNKGLSGMAINVVKN